MLTFILEGFEMAAQKIKISDLINELVDEALNIENSDALQKEKTQKFKRLATTFMNKMYGDKRRKESDKIKPTTARRYLTTARNACKKHLDVIHHRFNNEIERIAKKWPFYSEHLFKLLNLPPEDTRIAKKVLLDNLLDCKELVSEIDDLDFSKNNIKKQIIQLSNKYAAFKGELMELDCDNPFPVKNLLIRAFNNATELYEELHKVKVDHELIANLAMSTSDNDYIKRKQERSLSSKKNSKVYIDYPRYMQSIVDIFNRPKELFLGDIKNVAPLIFALQAASGRRAIEIIHTGNFVVKKSNELTFTGQAKKRDTDEVDKPRDIYCLIDSKVFVDAFKWLRSTPAIKSIVSGEAENRADHKSINEVIKGKISPYLSVFAKNFFIDKYRVAKDTRGLYGRICYERWYRIDKRWQKKDDNIFFIELFGHESINSQAYYMSYILQNYSGKFEVNNKSDNERWTELCSLDDVMPEIARMNAAVDIHNYVKEEVLINPNAEFNQTQLTTNKIYGKLRSRITVKNYLDAIGDLRFSPEPLTTQGISDDDETNDEEPVKQKPVIKNKVVEKPVNKQKPHIKAKPLGDDHWQVIVSLGDRTASYDLYCSERMEAMKLAYELFNGVIFEFRVTIPYKKGPHFEENVYAKNEKQAERQALKYAGFDGFKGIYNKIDVKKI